MKQQQQILVIGGTGKTGRRVLEKLRESGHQRVRSAARSVEPPFDWDNPSTWEATLTNVDAVYITYSPDLAVPASSAAISSFTSLASSLGVKKMVLLSGRGEREAQVCEEIVKATAREWTILQASWFNQNFSEGFFLDSILSGHFAAPRADTPEPFIDADDIADVVVECLLTEKHNFKTYQLTGPRLLTFRQAVDEIARATGRNITFEELTVDEYTNLLRSYQLPEDYIWLVSYLFTEVLDGRNSSVRNDLEQILGRKGKDFATYASEISRRNVWNPSDATSAKV